MQDQTVIPNSMQTWEQVRKRQVGSGAAAARPTDWTADSSLPRRHSRSSNLDVKVDVYPTDYPLPASRRQIKPGDRGELKDGFMYINGNRCVPVTHRICP